MTKELMIELFSTDQELLSTYHIEAPNTAEVCAERTWKDLQDSDVELHLIEKNGKVIGYYGIERSPMQCLTGFFLTPENRNAAMIELFWGKVNQHFDSDYFVGLYSKNTRAIDFMNKKTQTKYEVDNIVLFKVKR